jgi:hypothetical protein
MRREKFNFDSEVPKQSIDEDAQHETNTPQGNVFAPSAATEPSVHVFPPFVLEFYILCSVRSGSRKTG